MTLQTRNNYFKAGSIISALALAFVISAAFAALPAYPEAMEESAFRSSGLVQWFLNGRMAVSPYIPFISTLGAAVFSLVTLIVIRYSFEKTQSEEIFYIGCFALSMAFECFRIVVPLKNAIGLPGIYLYISSRLLIFGRCLGLFSLFAAGICAAGLRIEKQRNMVITAITVAMILALGIPIDGLSWDSSLNMQSGYVPMFLLVEAGLPVITVLSFFVAAHIRSAKEYIAIGLGILMVFAGRNILLESDTMITPWPGLLFLSAGAWLACSRLHRIYLWI
ncbi:MAG: hypothetical protein LBH43_13120 [Treponema sp.]|jgi:hypothetical protein|nr:hypothetical protein [Treponema sp.]